MRKLFRVLGWCVFALVGIAMLQTAFDVRHAAKETSQSAQQPSSQGDSAVSTLAVLAAKELHDSMRNPDSFKLAQVLVMPDGSVCYTYRAQNGFGGMNLEHAIMTRKAIFKTSEMDGFARLWNRHCADKIGQDETARVNDVLNAVQMSR